MSQFTTIGWCDVSWNPVHGCSAVGPGCANCYAEKRSHRWGHTEKPWTTPNAADNVILKGHKLYDPRSVSTPSRIFVNSMSDVFHREIPRWYRKRMFVEMAREDRHVYQILTKHGGDPEFSRDLMTGWDLWPSNVWMGVSVPNKRAKRRIDALRETDAAVKFLSCEPLLEPLGDVDLTGIDWVIAGGESGKREKRRVLSHGWIREIRDQCREYGVPFFFKQSSGRFSERGTAIMNTGGGFNKPCGNVEFVPYGHLTVQRDLPGLPAEITESHPQLGDWTPGGTFYGGVDVMIEPSEYRRITDGYVINTKSRSGHVVTIGPASELEEQPHAVVIADG